MRPTHLRTDFVVCLLGAVFLVPLASPTAAAGPGNPGQSICNDGIDNDDNGLTDYPADPGCDSKKDPSENGYLPPSPCNDWVDNDGDLLTDDRQDPGCHSPSDQTEEFDCMDGLDGDGDGLTDYPEDPTCKSPIYGTETNGWCEDGVDDDGDGHVDYPADDGCDSSADDYEGTSSGPAHESYGCLSSSLNPNVLLVCIDDPLPTAEAGPGLLL